MSVVRSVACRFAGVVSVLRFVLFMVLAWSVPAFAGGYAEHPAYAAFAQRMVKEHGFDAAALDRLFAAAERKDAILEAIARPKEKTLSWGEYRRLFITATRIHGGVVFWRANEAVLAQAAERYGVPPEIVVAIIGVETRYGGNMGSYRVIDALSTLAFDYPPRSEFFTRELENFLLLTRDQGFDPLVPKGSYAGAMGMGQFMPSSYRSYAVDFTGDGHADIWASNADAIGSVANYFREHGWTAGGDVVNAARALGPVDAARLNQGLDPTVRAGDLAAMGLAPLRAIAADELVLPLGLETGHGTEYWLGRHNFHVITRYNRSPLYAMAVYQLSQEIRAEAMRK